MRRRKILTILGLVTLAAVLIAAGLALVVRVYRHYRSDMLTYESRHLNSIVSASARGIDWMLDGYSMQLAQLLGRREFTRAEEEYLENGDPVVMRALMARPDVLVFSMPYSVAVFDADGTLLGRTDAQFPLSEGTDESFGRTTSLRSDGAGGFWFVFGRTSDNGLYYELAVEVQSLFAYHADAARIGRHGYLFMLDREGRFLSFAGGGESATLPMAEVREMSSSIDPDALRQLAAGERAGQEGYFVYRFPWPAFDDVEKPSEQTLVVVCPVFMESGGLVLGAAVSFQEFSVFLSDVIQEVTWIILMELGGVLILFLLATRIMVESRRKTLELQAVRERADLMEEINRQQQSLQHTERLQQLGVMTSGMVHEFNNMLTPIMSQSLLLLEELADYENTPQFENALDIYEASESARDVLRRMSAMGKKDVDMGFRTLDLAALLKKTMNLAAMAKDPHIVQELELPKEPLFVSGNEQLLTQAFLNLCINACQAMGTEGTLTIAAAGEVRSGHSYARVTVRDTGPGISEEKIGNIYDPFYTTKGERGTGLGLSICKKIIETHKGTIAAANRAEGGAVFTVRIPTCDWPGEDED